MLCKSPVMQSGWVQHCHKGQLLRARRLSHAHTHTHFFVRVGGQDRPDLCSLTLTWGITRGSSGISQLAPSRSPPTHLDPAGTLRPRPTNLHLNTSGENKTSDAVNKPLCKHSGHASVSWNLDLQPLAEALLQKDLQKCWILVFT